MEKLLVTSIPYGSQNKNRGYLFWCITIKFDENDQIIETQTWWEYIDKETKVKLVFDKESDVMNYFAQQE